ncbi:hypothetical protein CR513_21608, partial [Mucuna pruriens]
MSCMYVYAAIAYKNQSSCQMTTTHDPYKENNIGYALDVLNLFHQRLIKVKGLNVTMASGSQQTYRGVSFNVHAPFHPSRGFTQHDPQNAIEIAFRPPPIRGRIQALPAPIGQVPFPKSPSVAPLTTNQLRVMTFIPILSLTPQSQKRGWTKVKIAREVIPARLSRLQMPTP